MSINTSFKLIDDYGDPTLMEEVEVNLKHWLDWSFLEIGAWTNVTIESVEAYSGGTFADIYPTQDPAYDDFQNYIGIRKDWVYETGVTYRTPIKNIDNIHYDIATGDLLISLEEGETHQFGIDEVVTVSGNSVFNGNFSVRNSTSDEVSEFLYVYYNTSNDGGQLALELEDYMLLLENGDAILLEGIQTLGTGSGGVIFADHSPLVPTVFSNGEELSEFFYNVDYPNGRVVMNYALEAEIPNVCSYSYRNVQVYIEGQMPHNFEVQKNSLAGPLTTGDDGLISDPNFLQDPSHKIQLPAIIIEAIENRTSKGYELGAGSLKCKQDVLFTVIAQNKYEMKFLTDVLANQKHKTIPLFDIDVVSSRNDMPLTFEGYRNTSGKSYPEIINDSTAYWATCFIENAYVSQVETNSPDIYQSKVRYQLEVIKA